MFRRRTLLGKKGTPVKEGCLMFTATSSGTFKFSKAGLSYSTDGYTWTELAANTSTPRIASGKKIWFKGTMTPANGSGIGTFSSTGNFTASGTPMSLLFGDDFVGKTSLSGKNYAFQNLFVDCATLKSIDKLYLPATILSDYCYSDMFEGCYSLTSIPTGLLPSTTLANYCYRSMFYACTRLTSIPSDLLPATTLKNYCYSNMFRDCETLTNVPNLPATTLASGCYNHMFWLCDGLTSIPSDLLPATTLAESCYEYMFQECPNITTAPDLPATTLATYCYYGMFQSCTKLNSIRMLATDISAQYCLSGWVSGVASSGTFYKKSGVTISTGISGIPSGWTVVNE